MINYHKREPLSLYATLIDAQETHLNAADNQQATTKQFGNADYILLVNIYSLNIAMYALSDSAGLNVPTAN